MNDKDKSYFIKLILVSVIFISFLIVLGLMAYLAKNKQAVNPQPQILVSPEPTFAPIVKDEIVDWQTYRNEEYGFEFKYPGTFNLDVNLILRDWTRESVVGPGEFYYKAGQNRWKNRIAHKISYKKGDLCVSPDDVAPITDYDMSEINCVIYQLNGNYVIKYSDSDSVDYILVLNKGEIIYTFSKTNDFLFDQILSTFKLINDNNIINKIKNSEHYSQTFKQAIQLKDGKYSYRENFSSSELKIGIYNDMIALSDINNDGEKYAAIILESTNSGSGHFYELEIMKYKNNNYVYLASEYLGDRVEIYSIKIENKTVLVDMLDHDINNPNDSLCCPTLKKIARYELSNY